MARAEAVVDPVKDELEEAGDAMLLLVSRKIWEVCQEQARAERTTPGRVLAKALVEYAEKRGVVLQERSDAP